MMQRCLFTTKCDRNVKYALPQVWGPTFTSDFVFTLTSFLRQQSTNITRVCTLSTSLAQTTFIILLLSFITRRYELFPCTTTKSRNSPACPTNPAGAHPPDVYALRQPVRYLDHTHCSSQCPFSFFKAGQARVTGANRCGGRMVIIWRATCGLRLRGVSVANRIHLRFCMGWPERAFTAISGSRS
jgi:hypothetical protein